MAEMTQKKGTIIIPAYNESGKISKILSLVTEGGDFEVIVVCNGCADDTYEIACSFPDENVRVYNLKEGSKVKALTFGDTKASFFPRVYLDADIDVTAQSLVELCDFMENTGLLASGAILNYKFEKAPFFVRKYYEVWTQLPYIKSEHTIGSGIYALSAEGRQRFDAFPNVISDDGFVDNLFGDHEKRKAKSVSIGVDVPGNLWSLIKIKARATAGNRQLARLGHRYSSSNKINLKFFLTFGLSALVYLVIQILVKAYGAYYYRGKRSVWLRDETNR